MERDQHATSSTTGLLENGFQPRVFLTLFQSTSGRLIDLDKERASKISVKGTTLSLEN